MKKYLIRIETSRGAECTTINGDSLYPFQIANNLWNYKAPGYAAQRLEKLAKCWENNGLSVTRIFGTVADMPKRGNKFNVEKTLLDWSPNASPKAYMDLFRKYYYF